MPSTVIRYVAYDPDERRLRVQFVSGALYDYFAVPPHIYAGFIQAGSKGQYFSEHVRGRFAYEQRTPGEGRSYATSRRDSGDRAATDSRRKASVRSGGMGLAK